MRLNRERVCAIIGVSRRTANTGQSVMISNASLAGCSSKQRSVIREGRFVLEQCR